MAEDDSIDTKRLAVVGAGRLAEALCWLLADRPDGWRLTSLYARRQSRAAVLAALADATAAPDLATLLASRPEVILLAVNDDALGPLAEQLAGLSESARPACVLHFSGSREAAVLAPLQQRGWSAASLHPARSFAEPCAAASAFAGTVCALEGDEQAVALAQQLVQAWQGTAIHLDVASKRLYHAASVLANNLSVALLDAARQVATSAGLEPEACRRLLQPLAEQAVGNYFNRGASSALTGPLSRGDAEVVAGHLQALEDQDRQLAEVYRLLSRQALDIVRRQGNLDQAAIDRLERLLQP